MKLAAARRRELEGPKVNIYIRPADVPDIPQITTVYNHYIKNTVHAIELTETNNAEWQDRSNRAEKEKLAFLVAVSKGTKRDIKAKPVGRKEDTVEGVSAVVVVQILTKIVKHTMKTSLALCMRKTMLDGKQCLNTSPKFKFLWIQSTID